MGLGQLVGVQAGELWTGGHLLLWLPRLLGPRNNNMCIMIIICDYYNRCTMTLAQLLRISSAHN